MSNQPKLLLSQQTLRNLGDRSYEKRKQAALEVEQIIRKYNVNDNRTNIDNIITTLVTDYTYSTNPNNRKGGLIGMSAIAIALSNQSHFYLDKLIPPVLKCFNDTEPRVRYYACESLYNITKIARSNILIYFNEIFDGVCKLYADNDVDVKSGVQLLDRLLKDVVTESPNFQLEHFIPLLRERINIRNPFIRQLIITWISVLDSVPGVDMLEYLPEYLGGLFTMLSDPNKDIRQQVYATLADLLKQLSQTSGVDFATMIPILVAHATSTDTFASTDTFTRLTVLTWITEFARLGSTHLLTVIPELLSAIFVCVSDPEREINTKANKCHDLMLRAAEEHPHLIDLEPLLMVTSRHLLARHVSVRLCSLRWISMLLTTLPGALLTHLDRIFPALLRTLHDDDDAVVRLNLEVIARLALDVNGELDPTQFEMVVVNILTLFAADVKFLEARGSVIIRQLCVFLDCRAVYQTISSLLLGNVDVDFTAIIVQTLNLILLTSNELYPLRTLLKSSRPSSSSGSSLLESQSVLEINDWQNLFEGLFKTWCVSPVAALSLCLLAQEYELAWSLAQSIPNIEITVGLLLQLDKLVQLIESPVLIHVRLHILDPITHHYLIRTLYTLLALLPQSTAFTSLNTRLSSCAAMSTLANTNSSRSPKTELNTNTNEPTKNPDKSNVDIGGLVSLYNEVQRDLSEKRFNMAKQSLLTQNR